MSPRSRASKHQKYEYAVIGLGRFGASLARTLMLKGYSVLGIDSDAHVVQRMADEVTQAVTLDSTDEDALREVDIGSYDLVIIAIGGNFESNLLTTVALKSLGVRSVICKAGSLRQRDILLKVGADRVVLPEHEAGNRLAGAVTVTGVLDSMEFGPQFRVAHIPVPKRLVDTPLRRAGLERDFGVHLLSVRRHQGTMVLPDADLLLLEGDRLLVMGSESDIERLATK